MPALTSEALHITLRIPEHQGEWIAWQQRFLEHLAAASGENDKEVQAWLKGIADRTDDLRHHLKDLGRWRGFHDFPLNTDSAADLRFIRMGERKSSGDGWKVHHWSA